MSEGDVGDFAPTEVAEVVAYVRRHRDTDAPFDVALGAAIPPDPAQARDVVAKFEAAGATWLLEGLPTPDALSARLRAGVPS